MNYATQSQAMNSGHTGTNSAPNFQNYSPEDFYDEIIDPSGQPRQGTGLLVHKINDLPAGELLKRQEAAERSLFPRSLHRH